MNLATQPEYNSGIFDSAGAPAGNLLLSINNPFLTPEQRALIASNIENNPFSDRNLNCTLAGVDCGADRPGQDYFYLSRANTDIPTGRSTFTDDVYRVVGGLDGHFNLLAGAWNWEVVGNYGHSHAVGRTVDINTQNFFNALGTITEQPQWRSLSGGPGKFTLPDAQLDLRCVQPFRFGPGITRVARLYPIERPERLEQQAVRLYGGHGGRCSSCLAAT